MEFNHKTRTSTCPRIDKLKCGYYGVNHVSMEVMQITLLNGLSNKVNVQFQIALAIANSTIDSAN